MMLRLVIAGTALAVAGSTLGATTSGSEAAQATSAVSASAPTAVRSSAPTPRKPPKRTYYTPKTGAKFNFPLAAKESRTINKHIRLTIRSARSGSFIRIISWNYKSALYQDALLAAHDRGVTVRVLMSRAMARQQGPTGPFARLKKGLSRHQAKRPPARRSWARTCAASCRGNSGIAHVKFYTFSNTGYTQNVVIVSSANMTEVAARNQWNDAFTVVDNQGLFNKYVDIFKEATLDRRAHPPYQTYQVNKNLSTWFLPYLGPKATGDPVVKVLDKVRCKGATGRSGIGGRTAIRIGQTAILDDRGVAIARRLKQLYNSGCNIRIAYAVVGPNIKDILRSGSGRGPIPMQQIVQDFDGDGNFDRYIHMKSMTISGVYGKQTNAHMVYTGTQNWTAVGLVSDEAGFLMNNETYERQYAATINRIFNNPPPNPHPRPLATIVPQKPTRAEHELAVELGRG
ncbi:MAG TPA: phospholipase D-like domain-containing protein [Nocardioides sp.]|uniref:phospholipase D-like domain-containing protein n=1 Tax=Nocardioides sp. TaxID=35761 RepID=UPI002B92ADF7|nr:phospholipase D-like domain-containing protein [Nocardioides sp.]HQR27817.1 phospholipase D-like domain-containing protein [Nocardioides sp.]